jgi:hypothetical protein
MALVADLWGHSCSLSASTGFRYRRRYLQYHELPRTRPATMCLAGDASVLGVTDYVGAYPSLIAVNVAGRFRAFDSGTRVVM